MTTHGRMAINRLTNHDCLVDFACIVTSFFSRRSISSGSCMEGAMVSNGMALPGPRLLLSAASPPPDLYLPVIWWPCMVTSATSPWRTLFLNWLYGMVLTWGLNSVWVTYKTAINKTANQSSLTHFGCRSC